ncbi:MAG: GNAT family N-acetyltransferase [Actinomycetia bacterium]|nr:GNAT family N-acetyltransferase [Actinomycetes bacterium]MCP4228097.1 GNAT family N-acetyltransferase [Actinomycetes bacterium]
MAIQDGVEIRFITAEEIGDYGAAVNRGFGHDGRPDAEGGIDRFMATNVLEATIAAFDEGKIVATFGACDLDVTVPGGSVPSAGTTQVTVHPTHRRRGILTQMMRMHLEQAIDRDQPMAVLWASEERIYGRFGYGPACFGLDLSIAARSTTVPPGPSDVTVRMLYPEEAAEALPPIFEQHRSNNPGVFARTPGWWRARILADLEHWRGGATSLRFVEARRAGEGVGYVAYRHRHPANDWDEGTTQIIELVALDDMVRRTLWSFITNIDLYRNVSWWNAPVDEPVLIEADRNRSVKWSQIDTMWIRPLDVVRVLEARRYRAEGNLVFEVADPFLGRGGRFELEVTEGVGHCRSTTAEPELTMDISDLGSLYLGGRTATALARAARIEGCGEAMAKADDLFRTDRPPYCIEEF